MKTSTIFKVGGAQRNADGKVLWYLTSTDSPNYSTLEAALCACISLQSNHRRAGFRIRTGDYAVVQKTESVPVFLDENGTPVETLRVDLSQIDCSQKTIYTCNNGED